MPGEVRPAGDHDDGGGLGEPLEGRLSMKGNDVSRGGREYLAKEELLQACRRLDDRQLLEQFPRVLIANPLIGTGGGLLDVLGGGLSPRPGERLGQQRRRATPHGTSDRHWGPPRACLAAPLFSVALARKP